MTWLQCVPQRGYDSEVKAPQEYNNQGCGQKLPAGSFGPDFNKNQGRMLLGFHKTRASCSKLCCHHCRSFGGKLPFWQVEPLLRSGTGLPDPYLPYCNNRQEGSRAE